ncbi:Retrovirus-related Pol polyprotein from transposon RE2 [Sesamum angolense]|uniref:Retrovirus-related Pol polyprotein from transposon RE2 n=1 Tax=Sesamum angolense TaxID=2727404 RepID=A0AAE1X3G7_9LAMI|nr:Retrovirus-related Pol polyprotein from transposon RE2 [Sesamum angolense]
MGDKTITEGTTTVDHKLQLISDSMKLQGGDHPSMSLVSVPLDGNNYFSWVRAIKFALGAKQKLGFIDGSCHKPTNDKNEIEQWQRTDCMVVSWILNSISKDIAGSLPLCNFSAGPVARTRVKSSATNGSASNCGEGLLYVLAGGETEGGVFGNFWRRLVQGSHGTRRRNGRPPNARVMNVLLEDGERSIQGTSAVETQSNLSALVRTEVMRALQTSDVNLHRSNFVEYDDFAGYAHGRKGYKVMDLETEHIHIARDVVFHETTFPFHNITESEVLCPLPMITQDEEIRKLQDIEHDKGTVEDLTTQQEQSIIPRSCFVEGLSVLQEPKDFCEAQEKQEWREAMQQEIDALERNKTWEISDLPQGKNVIGCRWIYKIKLRPDGTIERCKARLVAKGFSQVEGIDYNDCFAPVAKTVTVRLFLAVAAGRGWPLHHLDVNNAFLHGSLDEVIYMDAPEGYKIPPGQVCRLKKSLYGLKQASRQWNQEFTDKIKAYGFIQSSHDHCLFVKGSGLQDFVKTQEKQNGAEASVAAKEIMKCFIVRNIRRWEISEFAQGKRDSGAKDSDFIEKREILFIDNIASGILRRHEFIFPSAPSVLCHKMGVIWEDVEEVVSVRRVFGWMYVREWRFLGRGLTANDGLTHVGRGSSGGMRDECR